MREIFEHPWIEKYRTKKQHKGNILSRAMDYDLNEFEEEEDQETSHTNN
jgi:hypothetical protein